MELPTKKRAFTAALANLSRLLLGAVLAVSGFVKAVDPKGLFYKLREYTTAFSLDAIPDVWVELASLMLPAAEFILGILLLTGVYNRLITRLVFIVFLLFTPFTLLIALWNPVQECGCFGDAIHLSNWATFFKNMLLLAFATMVCIKHRLFVRKVSHTNRWAVAVFSLFYIIAVEAVGTYNLPIIDFRPFAVGTDLRTATEDIPSEYKVIYRLEKDGQSQEFTDENYPDSTWKYLGSRTETIKEGRAAQIADFAFLDSEGNDYAPQIIADSGYVFMVIIHSTENADESRVDKINELYDFCKNNSLRFYAATASDEENMLLWQKRTGAEYPLLWADDIMLKTMIRANPGALLIKDGKILKKWNIEYMPHIEHNKQAGILEQLSMQQSRVSSWQSWLFVLSLSIISIIVFDFLTSSKKKMLDKKEKTDETISDINNINSKN